MVLRFSARESTRREPALGRSIYTPLSPRHLLREYLVCGNESVEQPSSIRSLSRRCGTLWGLYLDPPERALVLCVDEKTQPAGAADASRPSGAAEPRLPPPRHHLAVRGLGREDGKSRGRAAPPSPLGRVPQVS